MTRALPEEKEDTAGKNRLPYLSFSRINRYLVCPEQYRLYYVENLRLKAPKASLVFGQAVHQALAVFFEKKDDPVKHLVKIWREAGETDLTYGKKESWERFNESGQKLLEKFLKEEVPRIGNVRGVEKPFELRVTGLDLPVIGVIDLIADVDGMATVADFKTSDSAYGEHEVALSDQLTTYRLAEPDVEQAALCVLVKTKEPRIEWQMSRRSPAQLTEYLAKAGYVASEITSGRFYKRPGKHCSWCDFLPVCLGDGKRVEETLVRVR